VPNINTVQQGKQLSTKKILQHHWVWPGRSRLQPLVCRHAQPMS